MDKDDWGVISVDDHVIEPPHTWTSRVPARYRDRCPRVVERGDEGFMWDFDGEARMFSGLMCSVDTPPDEWIREIPRFADLYIASHDVQTRLKHISYSPILTPPSFPTHPCSRTPFL